MARVRHPNRVPVLILTGAGLVLLIVSAVGVYTGLALADRIYALLPPITIDADAIGGAAVALGIASLLAGLLHLAMALILARRGGATGEGRLVVGSVVCAVMGALALGWAVAALVSAASGSAPAEAMLPAGVALLLLAAGYAWATGVLVRVRRHLRAGG